MTPIQLRAAGKAGIASIVFIVFSTVFAELNAPFKNFLAGLFTHHWLGKGILSLAVFGIVYYYFSARARTSGKFDAWKTAQHLSAAAVLGGLLIFGFYVMEFLG